ncbi:MAG: hypothetical protein M5U01_23665 [Ardenticatenaceae bacterium]|nr:hypothetical protein [Ardenticatenaceae bacterium]
MVESFRAFIEANRDEIDALQILLGQPQPRQSLSFRHIKELAERLQQPPRSWTPEGLWQAYAQVDRDRVRGASARRVLADLVSLIRHAVDIEADLVPYPERVRERYAAWLAQQETMGRAFTPEQRRWLDRIAEQIGVNLAVEPRDLDDVFADRGGRVAARRVLGDKWRELLDELNVALAA